MTWAQSEIDSLNFLFKLFRHLLSREAVFWLLNGNRCEVASLLCPHVFRIMKLWNGSKWWAVVLEGKQCTFSHFCNWAGVTCWLFADRNAEFFQDGGSIFMENRNRRIDLMESICVDEFQLRCSNFQNMFLSESETLHNMLFHNPQLQRATPFGGEINFVLRWINASRGQSKLLITVQ